MIYGVTAVMSDESTQFFAVNAYSENEAKEVIEEMGGTDITVEPFVDLLWSQYDGVAILGTA